MTQIDIVIPCAGRVQDLLRLLDSIERECKASLAEVVASIIATDDRHAVGLGEQIAQAHPAVRYVAGPARGPAANRNHGARQGDAEWILFLDDDCYLEADLIATYAARIASFIDVDVFEGAIHPVGERPNGNHHAPINTTGGYLWSCNMLIWRRTFEAVGGFDERFPFACLEDCDLMTRLQAAAVSVQFAADAVVLHPWRSVGEREVTRGLISHAIYADKHPAFVQEWTTLHLLRALRGRVRQYRAGRFRTIPWSKYRTVAYDVVAPLAVFALMRIPAWRRRVVQRHFSGLAAPAPVVPTHT
ncbi:MAG: glycosyltransferase family 2 protein [Leptothrix sp. (in: b-proteobacteria)]